MLASENAESDDTLIRAALAGDSRAYGDLVARYKGRVFGIAARFAGNAAELEDIAQDVFIRTYFKLAQFNHSAPFEHWIVRITTHACYDHLRKRRRQPASVSMDTLHDAGFEPSVADPVEHPDVERLHAAMARLAPKERLVLTLLELEERSLQEIADLTGWSVTNVKVRAFRARAALRKLMEQPT